MPHYLQLTFVFAEVPFSFAISRLYSGKCERFFFKLQFSSFFDCPLGFTTITGSWAWNHAAEWNMVASSEKNSWLHFFYIFIYTLDRRWGTEYQAVSYILIGRWCPRTTEQHLCLHNVYNKSSLRWKLITQPKPWKGQVTLIGKSKQELKCSLLPSLKAHSFLITVFGRFRRVRCILHSAAKYELYVVKGTLQLCGTTVLHSLFAAIQSMELNDFRHWFLKQIVLNYASNSLLSSSNSMQIGSLPLTDVWIYVHSSC